MVNRQGAAILMAFLLAPAAARACDIPVYQYAREHWNPDAYQAAMIHHGPMDAAARAGVADLQKRIQTAPHVPFTLQLIDADHPADETEQALCRSVKRGDGPRVVVRPPGAAAGDAAVWEGPWTGDAAATLADSPRRREIADRLLAGDAAVWVLLECGRPDADDAAAARMRDGLKRPGADGQPPLKCSVVRVSRADRAEQLLVQTLLSTEPDLRGRNEPMAFPVYGRGRVLYALVGAGVNAENVRHALDFLVGGCSCTIKRQNPGVDLPLAAEWGPLAAAPAEEKQAPTAGDAVRLTPLPTKPARTAAAPPPRSGQAGSWLAAGVAAAALLVLVTGWWAFRTSNRPRRSYSRPESM